MNDWNDEQGMTKALRLAQNAYDEQECPIGAVLVKEGRVLAGAYNTREVQKNPLAHAEVKVLQAGAEILGNWRLTDTTLYVTLEPCPMCLGALLQARVGRLVFGCFDSKREKGFFPSLKNCDRVTGNNHTVQIVSGILQEESSEILKRFFRERRG